MDYCQITTPCGEIRGEKDNGTLIFKGVRYAYAERFCYPTVTTSFGEGVYDATQFGAACPQYRYFYDETANNAFYHNEFRAGTEFSYDEDCHFLNVYAPETAKNAPVVIFIHGGNHTKGSGDEKETVSCEYAKRGVILVTINYRLNVFGLYADKDFQSEGHTGGFQFYDQLAAIRWVKNNIAAFGGNPENVTLMGQSAGAMSVQPLILSPEVTGLVKGAIMLSGGGLRIGPWKVRRVEDSLDYWAEVKSLAGCKTADDLKKIDSKTLFDAWNKSNGIKKLIYTLPYADGKLITGSLPEMFARDKNNIPVIVSVTKNDMVPIVLYLDAKRYAKRLAKRGVSAYLGYFNRNLPGDEKGAFHSSDLWYVFGELQKSWRPFGADDKKLSDVMIDYYCNFAKGQNPNGEGLPAWGKATATRQRFMSFNNGAEGMRKPSAWKLLLNTVANGGSKR